MLWPERYYRCIPVSSQIKSSFPKPPLADPISRTKTSKKKLQFSISYTEGIVAFALATDGDIGIDVEHEAAGINCYEVAQHHFSAIEFQELKRLPEDQLKTRFFQYWTLKESYIKARGYGMSIALDSFSIVFPQNGSGQISILPPPEERCENQKHWQFETMVPGSGYQGAIALRNDSEALFQIATRKAVPLMYEREFKCL